ncbi:MAG: DNA adenine methylase [Lewinellaceae bacterium]|nr:DNA adenine methylase [Lewinellaceae bacterium]
MQVSQNTIDYKKFPTTRFQGSKRKILPWIAESLEELEFETVLDGFGGTGSVSYLFKNRKESNL